MATKVKCLKCGDIIESKGHRHNFVWCKCKSCFVDGGDEYSRGGGDPEHMYFFDDSDSYSVPKKSYLDRLYNYGKLFFQHLQNQIILVQYVWLEVWKQKAFKLKFVVTLLITPVVLLLFNMFLYWIEARQGFSFKDTILAMMPLVDFTIANTILIYGGLIVATLSLLKYPQQLLFAMQAYIVMILFRTIAMFLLPLEPPYDIIPLQDPIVSLVSPGEQPTQDLFFSGHTSTIFLYFLVSMNKYLKIFFLLCLTCVIFTLLSQRVHYSIDVFSAPFFAYGAYRITKLLKGTKYANTIL